MARRVEEPSTGECYAAYVTCSIHGDRHRYLESPYSIPEGRECTRKHSQGKGGC